MPSVGEKYKFGSWELDKNCPLSLLIRFAAQYDKDGFAAADYKDGFEIIQVGKFITIKFFNTKIEIKFPAKYWNVLTLSADPDIAITEKTED